LDASRIALRKQRTPLEHGRALKKHSDRCWHKKLQLVAYGIHA
jgi:hypothetical protein